MRQTRVCKEVPRERTMILDYLTRSVCAGQIKDCNTFNPYLLRNIVVFVGWNFLYEPLELEPVQG